MSLDADNSEALRFVWDRQRVWSLTANALQNRVAKRRAWALVTLLGTAVLGAVATQTEPALPVLSQWLAGIAAGVVAVATFLRQRARPLGILQWTDARDVSEQLKAQIYMFLAGVAPYRDGETGRLVKDASGAWQKAADEVHLMSESDRRDLPAVTDVASYVKVRVKGQIDGYYRVRAEKYRRLLRICRILEVGLGSVGVLLGAAASVAAMTGATLWIVTLTTVVTAIAAHSAQARYEFLETEYTRTANRLEDLLALRATVRSPTPGDDDEFVAACERVIFDQNEVWLTKLKGVKDEEGQ
jgi:hypothetical protein